MVLSNRFYYLWCSSLLLLAACHSKSPPSGTLVTTGTTTQHQVMNSDKPRPRNKITQPNQTEMPVRIAPGSCRLVGKVLAILPGLEPDKDTPCGKVPCKALVKVQHIVGYGSAFGKPLASAQEINVYFHFTLSPTARYFPELTTPLPGLKAGDIFQADITRAGEGDSQKAAWFQVYTYALKK